MININTGQNPVDSAIAKIDRWESKQTAQTTGICAKAEAAIKKQAKAVAARHLKTKQERSEI